MAVESITHCESANNTFGRGFEGDTEVITATPDETLRLESPEDGWVDSAGLYCASLMFLCKMCFFNFAPVDVVPKRPNGEHCSTTT